MEDPVWGSINWESFLVLSERVGTEAAEFSVSLVVAVDCFIRGVVVQVGAFEQQFVTMKSRFLPPKALWLLLRLLI
jgi:hypothetical protein